MGVSTQAELEATAYSQVPKATLAPMFTPVQVVPLPHIVLGCTVGLQASKQNVPPLVKQ
jgi:hypothetical protein